MNKLGVKEIEQILPHRHPFLLVDYIEDYEPGKFAVGYKCVRRCGNLKPGRKQRQDCILWRDQELQIPWKSCSGG